LLNGEQYKQFSRDTRLLWLEQARWSANPLGMLWPEMDTAFLTVAMVKRRRLRRGGRWSSSPGVST
jgi:hypothetical protein